MTARPGPDFVKSLERGLAIIRALGAGQGPLRLAEVAAVTGITPGSARRLLFTLVELGYVQREEAHYSLQPRALALGGAFLSRLAFLEAARSRLRLLAEEIREPVSVSLREGSDVVCVMRVPLRRVMTASFPVGTRFPAFTTADGLALLAQLDLAGLEPAIEEIELQSLAAGTVSGKEELRQRIQQARTDGFAVVDQGPEEGLVAAAVPLRLGRGGVEALALSASFHSGRCDARTAREVYVPQLRDAAEAIEIEQWKGRDDEYAGGNHRRRPRRAHSGAAAATGGRRIGRAGATR